MGMYIKIPVHHRGTWLMMISETVCTKSHATHKYAEWRNVDFLKVTPGGRYIRNSTGF
jgi:hypothetical protein